LYYLTDSEQNTIGECEIELLENIFTHKLHSNSVTWDPDTLFKYSKRDQYFTYDVYIPDDVTIHGNIKTISSSRGLIMINMIKHVSV
jgi:hypothetical protein